MSDCTSCGQANPQGARFCNACGLPLASPAADERFRRTVTIVFTDVIGSTALGDRYDPEVLSRVMSEYFKAMKPLIDRHGGTVGKFMGDAVMAVFGIPTLHEDDALRAVRAALEMRQTLPSLNAELERRWGVTIETRTGINTGQVAPEGLVPDQNFVAGDAANVAARLQQAAPGGEILISEATHRLVRGAAETERLAPLELRGKAAPVTAYRLVKLPAGEEAIQTRTAAPIVGRRRELARLSQAYRDAAAQSGCRLVTVVGDAGVGKSRVARELLRELEGEAEVLSGRCLPYGEGITYWPLAEMVRRSAGIGERDTAEEARMKLAALCAGAEDASFVGERIARLVGLVEGWVDSAEAFLAVRRLFEFLASRRPLVAFFDDIQWAEPTLLELIEHVATQARGRPIFLLCLARPDLLEAWPQWRSIPGAFTMPLEPLSPAEAEHLIGSLLGAGLEPQVGARIATVAEGNPLFVEQLVSMLIDDGLLQREEGRWAVAGDLATVAMPSTIHALLAARLERLDADERRVLGRAAVVGQVFHVDALEALASELLRPVLPAILKALVRKELLSPARPDLAGRRTYRFRHLLIRDAAYERLTKQDRAQLHERFAAWLERAAGERVSEYDEIAGYHLEQAYRCRAELGPLDAHAQALARRAADRLAAAGRRAFGRGDMRAASGLLDRAAAVLEREPERRLELLPELGKVRRYAGDRTGAEAALSEGVAQAVVAGNRGLEMLGRVEQMFLRLYTDSAVETGDALAVAEEALRIFIELGDDHGLAQSWSLVGHANWLLCRGARMEEAFSRALAHMRRSDEKSEWGETLRMLALVYWAGPMPVDRAIERCEGVLRLGQGFGAVEVSTRAKIAALEAMRGRFDVARELYRRSKEIGEELGLRLQLAGVGNYSGPIEMLAGDLDAAERELRASCEAFEELGETGTLSTSAAFLARTLEAQGRLEEAEHFTALSAKTAAVDDLASQFISRGVRGRVLARRGELEQAELLAREAVTLAARTDFLSLRGETLLDLAEVLRLAGADLASASAVVEARDLFEAKGNVVLAERARGLLGDLVLEKRPA